MLKLILTLIYWTDFGYRQKDFFAVKKIVEFFGSGKIGKNLSY